MKIQYKDVVYDSETGIFTRNKKRAGNLDKTSGYRNIQVDGERFREHRLAWMIYHKEVPNCIDHINHIKTDNRINNLRNTTMEYNGKNQKLHKNNKSGNIGVHFEKQRNKWRASIHVNGKTMNLGRFNTKEEAIKQRKKYEKKYGFHQNHGAVSPSDGSEG